MAVSLAEEVTVIDLTDEDDVMYVDDKQGREKIVTSPSCSLTLSTVSNSNEHKDKVAWPAPENVMHEEWEKSKSKYPAVSEKPNQPRHFNFPRRHFGTSKIVNRSFQCQWFNKWK